MRQSEIFSHLSLRTRLARAILLLCCLATLTSAGFCFIAEYANTYSDLSQLVHETALQLAHDAHDDDTQRLTRIDTNKDKFRITACIYDIRHVRINAYQSSENCPELLVGKGNAAGVTAISRLLPRDEETAGLVYVRGTLNMGWWTGHLLLYLLIAFCIALVLSSMAIGHLHRRLLSSPLEALHGYLDCLKDNALVACPLPKEAAAPEIAELGASIADMYRGAASIAAENASRQALKIHSQMLSGLLASVRQHLSLDYSLVSGLNDYALLLQLECADILPPPRIFDIARALDVSINTVRSARLVPEKVHLMASVKRSMPKRWSGQPELLEGLLRHLLVAALYRTRKGFVSLRVESDPQSLPGEEATLRIVLEDSGPHIQRGQLQQWLNPSDPLSSKHPLALDITWRLVASLTACLRGHAEAESPPSGGLKIKISLPQLLPPTSEQGPTMVITRPVHMQPLLLAIDEHDANRDLLARQFIQAGTRVFVADSCTQAAEWLAVLPFSVVMFNTRLQDAKKSLIPQLVQRRSDVPIPVWAVVTDRSFVEFDYWRQAGVTSLLLQPLYHDDLLRMCAQLPPPDPLFYHLQNPLVLADFPPAVAVRLPELNDALGQRIREVATLLGAIDEHTPEHILEQAHALKSAALSLGYMRLAGLMGALEQTVRQNGYDSFPHNTAIIAECLFASRFGLL